LEDLHFKAYDNLAVMLSKPLADGAPRKIVVVSGYGRDPVTPRGQRTRRLVEALSADWDVSLVAMRGKPSSALPDGSTPRHAALRQLAMRPLRRMLLDRFEPWSALRFSRWRPDADAALLIAAPWSPIVYASRRLVRAGIPYVIDVGDPWILTTEGVPSLPIRRASQAERFLWEHAAGAIVTTRAQRERLLALFAELPILVRPNGYNPIERVPMRSRSRPADDMSLRIAHFGMLSPTRLDPVPFLVELQRSERWRSIVFSQFGNDFGIGLDRVSLDSLRIEHRPPLPWEKVVEGSWEFDAALVVAYPRKMQLPSKAIEYSTLRLPRIALTNPDRDDALREYALDHTGWLVLSNGEPDIARRVWEHVRRPWLPTELASPPEDAWPAVANRISEFVATCVDEPDAARPAWAILNDEAPL
jgi:hypothetical protein